MIVTDKDKIINGLRAEVKVATNLSVVRLGLRRPPLSYQGLAWCYNADADVLRTYLGR